MEPNQNETKPVSNDNLMAIFAYLGILILIPFLTNAKNNHFVKFHLKQGLVLLVAYLILMVIGNMSYMMFPLFQLLYIAIGILDIIGIINVITSKQKELPLVGQFSKYFTF